MTKKNFIFLFFLAIALLFSGPNASAECDGFYLAGRGGSAKYKIDDSRSGVHESISDYVVDKRRFTVSGALGYRYRNFRAELEYVWRRKNSNNIGNITLARFKSYSYMFVVYYDFFPDFWFTPFVNAGAGYTRHRLDFNNKTIDQRYSAKDNNFTWSLGAGVSAKLTNRLNLDVGYRYYDMGDLSELNGKTDVTDHEIYAGLRYVL